MPRLPLNTESADPNLARPSMANLPGGAVRHIDAYVRDQGTIAKAIHQLSTTLVLVQSVYDRESDVSVSLIHAKSQQEKIDLLLAAGKDDVVLLCWPGPKSQSIFAITDIAPWLQALGLRPAKVDPIVDSEGREWLASDVTPTFADHMRARRQLSRAAFDEDEVDDDA